MSHKKMDLFYILKLNTKFIMEHSGEISLDFKEAKRNGLVISLGDNQLLKFIRHINRKDFDREAVSQLYASRNTLKQKNNSKENSIKIVSIQNTIDEMLFVPDLISIKVDTTKKDYKDLCKFGFTVCITINEKEYKYTYKRLCAGAGQLRRNSSLFVNDRIFDELENTMMCGLTKNKIGKINLAKFSAYYALYTSATNKVTTPRICVVKDFEYTLKDQKVSWIYDDEDGSKNIQDKTIDIEQNAFDGSGMISVHMAEIWKEDLGLDYLPSSFILRSAWVKGLVSVFDFRKFAREVAHKDLIVDAWGKEHPVDKIDVILTCSQFKMWKKYSSWDEYSYFHNKFKHIFGVARVNKKENDFITPLNYQYVQSNYFTEETIKGLADFSIDWIKQIMTKDRLYTSLFLIGCHDEGLEANDIESSLDLNIAKSLLYNPDVLNDDYIRNKVNQMIDKKIRQIKIGKLYVEGSYDFAIPDLYAMAEHAFGMEVKGLLKSKQAWNLRWVNKGSDTVAMMRSPLVAPSENQLMNIYSDLQCENWFKYISSGMMLNIWDTAMMRASDADYDGDIVLTTDNTYMIGAVRDDLKPITYEKKTAKEQRLNYNNFATMDTKSFNSKIGFITNLASNFIAMLSNFKEDSEEYKELSKRVDLLRFYQGSAIDATKGDVFIPPPKHWSKKQRYISIPDDASPDEVEKIKILNEKIRFDNRICCNKKAYFFGYIYPSYLNDYKRHISSYNQASRMKFGMTLDKLKKKEDKTEEEQRHLKLFYRYLPLLNNGCTMNTLSRYVESIEFENKWKKSDSEFDWKILLSHRDFKPNKNLIKKVCIIIKEFSNNYKNLIVSEKYLQDRYDMDLNTEFKFLCEDFENQLYSINSNIENITDHIVYAYYNYFKNYSKNLIWDIFGEQIVRNIKANSTHYSFPIEDMNGTSYLGKKYSLLEVEL